MIFESVRLLAVISVAICLIPAGAHFFELVNKMSLSTAEYITTQKIYAGWSFFGVAIIAAVTLLQGWQSPDASNKKLCQEGRADLQRAPRPALRTLNQAGRVC